MEFPFDEFTGRDWQTLSDGGPIRFAMIGLGWWTRAQAIPAVEDTEFCETTVVVSGSPAKAEKATGLAESIEHALTYEEFHDGTAAAAYDAVYVCTPNGLHLPFVETAARLGKDVLCEKPMESTVPRAKELVEVTAKNDMETMIAYRMQTEPAVRRAREMVRSGLIGDPVHVHGNMSQRLLQVIPDPDQWRLDPDLSGGATVMDIGLYPINTTRFLLDADPVAVQARSAYSEEPFAAVGDEHTAFTLVFPDDVFAVCTASQNAYHSSHLRVTGTEGEIIIDPAFFNRQKRGFSVSIGDESYDIGFKRVNQMVEEFDYFAHNLLTESSPTPDPEHGLVDMQTMASIYEAAEQDGTVEVSADR